jgi:hypothetical protein
MSTCKKCGGPVDWNQKNGRWHCYNAGTAIEHWDTCSDRRFAAIKASGKFFEEGATKGYRTMLKKSGVQYTQQSSGVIKAKRAIVPCNDCVLPWEVCDFGCPNEFSK